MVVRTSSYLTILRGLSISSASSYSLVWNRDITDGGGEWESWIRGWDLS